MRPSGEVPTYSPPFGAAARACTSSSPLSKKVVTLPSRVMRNTLPSFPLPAHSDPFPSGIAVHRNGAVVSLTIAACGPSTTRPSLSMESPSTSPFKKSACVATVQNVGEAARTAVNRQTTATPVSATARRAVVIGFVGSKLARLYFNRQRARSDHCHGHRDLILAERRAAHRAEAAAVAIAFEYRQHRRRQRRHRLTVDHGPGGAIDQADVDAIVASRRVEDLDHLRDALRLHRAAHLTLFDGVELSAVGHHDRQRP